MRSKSENPFVMQRRVGTPFLSRSAFVATVVPIRMDSIFLVGTGALIGTEMPMTCSITLLIPSVGASW